MLRESTLAWLAAVPELEAEPTPFLAVDLDAMERNLRRMAERPVRLRPHVKHHKSSELARLQVEAGAVGVTCATTEEVDAVVRAGITDVLLANVVVQTQRAAALAEASSADE
jgi:D-serine deaminase-like pyridoxal phosphate-dependent protein